MRSRDPGLLNSPNFDAFPQEFRDALSPLPANAFSTSADFRQTLFSFKLGKALEAARMARNAGEHDVQRARQMTALDAIRAYNELLCRNLARIEARIAALLEAQAPSAGQSRPAISVLDLPERLGPKPNRRRVSTT